MPSTLIATTAVLLALFLAGCDSGKDDTGLVDADGDGRTVAAGDCNDADPAVHPGADEVWYDGVDQDCSGGSDYDADGDGYDSDAFGGADCDDADAGVHPGADEWCDLVDSDCDGTSDDDHSLDIGTWYLDRDSDGYGDPAMAEVACVAPSQFVADRTDCDDFDPAVHPGAEETCDGIDEDCDGVADEGCEDCTNGLDDDKDGLVDCEDGDCAAGEPCLEILCTDGLDGDDDGLVDCEDEDCWGPACHPAGVRARVWSGRFEESFNHIWRSHEGCLGGPWYRGEVDRWERDLVLRSIRGTVQVLPPGAASWDKTAARTTCAWSAASVSFQNSHVSAWGWDSHSGWARFRFYAGLPIRSDLRVDPGCRLAPSPWFLPQTLAVACGAPGRIGTVLYHGGGASAGPCTWQAYLGPLWYVGSLGPGTGTFASAYTTTPATSSCDGGFHWTRSTHWRYTGPLGPGSVYTALP